MEKIERGMFVECKIPNSEKSWPEEKKKSFGFVTDIRSVVSQTVIDVITIVKGRLEFRIVSYDEQDVQVLSVPMSDLAQKALLTVAQTYRECTDRLFLSEGTLTRKMKRIGAIMAE